MRRGLEGRGIDIPTLPRVQLFKQCGHFLLQGGVLLVGLIPSHQVDRFWHCEGEGLKSLNLVTNLSQYQKTRPLPSKILSSLSNFPPKNVFIPHRYLVVNHNRQRSKRTVSQPRQVGKDQRELGDILVMSANFKEIKQSGLIKPRPQHVPAFRII